MGPFQICGCLFREPEVSEIAHLDSWPVQDLQCAVSDPQCHRRAVPFVTQPLWQGILVDVWMDFCGPGMGGTIDLRKFEQMCIQLISIEYISLKFVVYQ